MLIKPGGERVGGGIGLDVRDGRRLIVEAAAIVVQLIEAQDKQGQREHGTHNEQLETHTAQEWYCSASSPDHLVSLSVKSVLRRRGGGQDETRVSIGGREEAA